MVVLRVVPLVAQTVVSLVDLLVGGMAVVLVFLLAVATDFKLVLRM